MTKMVLKMKYKELSIKELLPLCEDNLALPHFQRDYVWDKKNVIYFLDSIYKNWPTGLIMIWVTNKLGRHFGSLWNNPRDSYNSKGLILDGQQRLTTLKILSHDGYLPLKTKNGNRESHYFYFDSDKEMFFANTERQNHNSGYIDVYDILRNKYSDEISKIRSEVKKNLKQIQNYKFPIKCVTVKKNNEAIEIFNRVNTAGKNIDKVVVAFAKIKDMYPKIAEKIIVFQREWIQNGFDLSDRVIMNSFMVVNNIKSEKWTPGTRNPDRRVDDYLKTASPSSIERDWKKTSKRIDNSLAFLQKIAGFDSDQFLTTENAIVSLCGYYEINDLDNNLSSKRKNILLKWLYRTILLRRYSYTSNFIRDLKDLHENHRFGDVMKITKSELNADKDYSHEGIISVMYALGISKNMMDYANNKISWSSSRSNKKRIHVDHIYPKSRMKKSPMIDKIEKYITDDIGNSAFILGADNMSKNKRFPGEQIHKTKIGQWLNVGHIFLTEKDYEDMKKNQITLEKNCKEIKNFIKKRRKIIIDEIKTKII